jgi:hypothetical protein
MEISAFYGTKVFILVICPRNKHCLSPPCPLSLLFPADVGFTVLRNPNVAVESCDGFDRAMTLESAVEVYKYFTTAILSEVSRLDCIFTLRPKILYSGRV